MKDLKVNRKKIVKFILLFLLILYLIFSFHITIDQNKNIDFRIYPGEKISYIFVPSKLKKAYNDYNPASSKKRIAFSKERILFSIDNSRLYIAQIEDGEPQVNPYIPEYTYTVTDTFNLSLLDQDYKYADTIRFSIMDSTTELDSWYFRIMDDGEVYILPGVSTRILELLQQNPNAKFIITDSMARW